MQTERKTAERGKKTRTQKDQKFKVVLNQSGSSKLSWVEARQGIVGWQRCLGD